jgi:hypothetical protein
MGIITLTMAKMRSNTLKIVILTVIPCLSFPWVSYAQLNTKAKIRGNSNVVQTTVNGDNMIYDFGGFRFTVVSNNTNHNFDMRLFDASMKKWTLDNATNVESISAQKTGVVLYHINRLEGRIEDLYTMIENDYVQKDSLKKEIQITQDSLITARTEIERLSAIKHFAEQKIRILETDKAEWAYSFIPGVRQWKLGYKTSAYFYWGAYGVSLISLAMGMKHDSDYNRYRNEINQTNYPSDDLYNKMDRAERIRDDMFTASAVIAIGTYAINLIDALAISNKRKILPENIIVAPVATPQYTGLSMSYEF